MKTALVQCPAWGRLNPPLALSALSAYLRSKGKEVSLLDLNNELFHEVKGEDKDLWQLGKESFWSDRASVLKFASDHSELIDRFVNKIIETDAELIGFSIFSSSKELSLIIAGKIKKIDQGKKIIFGGPHCAPHMHGPEIIKDDSVDIMVIGEGELILDELVDKFEIYGKVGFCKGTWLKKEGEIIDCGTRDLIEDLSQLPFADFSDFSLSAYDAPSRLPIYLGRGCPNRCVYCNDRSFWRGYRNRTGEKVFEEMRYQVGKYNQVTHFDFSDSLVNANIRELSHMADLIILEGLKITWAGQAVIRPYMTPDLLTKFKKSGCVCFAYGIESGSQKVLDLMKKGFIIEDAERVIQDTHNAGIDVAANFMFGFPGENDEDFQKTLDFISRNKEYISTLNPSLAYTGIGVGTYLYDHPQEYNIDLSAGWLYWRTKNNENTYEIRKKRYERFCKLALSLDMGLSYPVDIK
jgi:anaerobic magnesium-protoporphyrin IX monomethyl ester cyclase